MVSFCRAPKLHGRLTPEGTEDPAEVRRVLKPAQMSDIGNRALALRHESARPVDTKAIQAAYRAVSGDLAYELSKARAPVTGGLGHSLERPILLALLFQHSKEVTDYLTGKAGTDGSRRHENGMSSFEKQSPGDRRLKPQIGILCLPQFVKTRKKRPNNRPRLHKGLCG
jgi:hypothetical protein